MSPSRSFTAIKIALSLALLCAPFTALAAPAGTVTQASGALLAHHVSGRTRILAAASSVEEGETLASGKGAYAQFTLADGSTITLKPEAQVRIDRFSYDAAKPADDRAELTLVAGAVRIQSGEIAKRSKARYMLATRFGTIEVGNSTFVAEISAPVLAAGLPIHFAAASTGIASDASPDALFPSGPAPLRLAQIPPLTNPGNPAPGLYVHVIDGLINLSNQGGSFSFAPGQFGFTPNLNRPPALIPTNPGILFTPPPAFTPTPGPGAGSGGGKPPAVDCEVR